MKKTKKVEVTLIWLKYKAQDRAGLAYRVLSWKIKKGVFACDKHPLLLVFEDHLEPAQVNLIKEYMSGDLLAMKKVFVGNNSDIDLFPPEEAIDPSEENPEIELAEELLRRC